MMSSLLRPLRGFVCVSWAGLADPLRTSQIASFSPFRCTDFQGLGQTKHLDIERYQPDRSPDVRLLPVGLRRSFS
jgi:hypothetical protein